MMKRIVEGVAYNTDTSTCIARKPATRQDERGREVDEMTTLFQTARGAYFLHKTSSVAAGRDNETREWDEIIPMTSDEARTWMLSGNVQVIHDPFAEGIPEAEPEAEQGTTIYLRVPATLKQRVEAAAKKVNLSGNAWVIRCLEVGLTNPLVHLGPLTERLQKILSTPALLKRVDELEFSVRTENCLKNAHIIYIGDLVQKIDFELLRTANFGRKSLNEVEEVLGQMGLHLGMEVPGWPPKNIEDLAKCFEDDDTRVLLIEAAVRQRSVTA